MFFFCFCISKPKEKTKWKSKKTLFEAKPKSLFRVLVFWFLVLRFWGYCHSLHITSFQIYQDNKQGLYMFILSMCVCLICIHIYIPVYICMCVLKDMIQEALRWISGGVYIIYTLAANDFGLVEHTPQSKRPRSWPKNLLLTWFY